MELKKAEEDDGKMKSCCEETTHKSKKEKKREWKNITDNIVVYTNTRRSRKRWRDVVENNGQKRRD